MERVGRAEPFVDASIAALTARHQAAIEADLHRYYRIDLRDLWRPRGGRSGLTWRLARVLIDQLPPESATKTRIREQLTPDQLKAAAGPPDGSGPWSHLEMLTASCADVLGQIWHVLAASNGTKVQPPPLIPRPGVAPPKSRRLTGEAVTYLRKLHANRR